MNKNKLHILVSQFLGNSNLGFHLKPNHLHGMPLSLEKLRKRGPVENPEKANKKKIDRFDGLSEEEVQRNTLRDLLRPNLDLVFIGINPSLMAAHKGRYYAGPGNHFYKLLSASELVPKVITFEEDDKLLDYNIGLTNIVSRATRSSNELKRTEIQEGASLVHEKMLRYKPRIAVFNGKCIYEVFANKTNFSFGLQPEQIGDSFVYVVPSSSARCSNFPRMEDKLHFYEGLKKYLMYLKGQIQDIDIKDLVFEGKCKQAIPSTSKMWRRKNVSTFPYGGRIANKDTLEFYSSGENIADSMSTEFISREDIRNKEDANTLEGGFGVKESQRMEVSLRKLEKFRKKAEEKKIKNESVEF